jgi:hypothetical protein
VSPTCPDSPENATHCKDISLTCPDSPADASSRNSLFVRCPNTQVKTANIEEKFDCTHPDTRATCPDMLQRNIHLLIHVRTPSPRNSFLTCFRIFRAYLKRLLGSFSLRIFVENSSMLREGLLGINIYMYLS